jgi:hypothetical protein
MTIVETNPKLSPELDARQTSTPNLTVPSCLNSRRAQMAAMRPMFTGSVVERESYFDRDLPMRDLPVCDSSAGFQDIEPVDVAQRLVRSAKCSFHRDVVRNPGRISFVTDRGDPAVSWIGSIIWVVRDSQRTREELASIGHIAEDNAMEASNAADSFIRNHAGVFDQVLSTASSMLLVEEPVSSTCL